MTREPKNDQAVCSAVARFVGEQRHEALVELDRPDQRERRRKAVELVLQSPTRQFVVEHTRIESYPGRIEDGQKFMTLLEPLERVFGARLPDGKYSLIIEAGVARRVRRSDAAQVRLAVALWVLSTAPTLSPHGPGVTGFSVRAQLEGVPFEVTLQRWSAPGESRLLIYRSIPPELERLRKERINVALHKKLGKLAEAKREFSAAESILILESDDIALASHDVIGHAVRAALADHAELPDTIYLVETDRGLGWQLWLMKTGDSVFPDIAFGVGPFDLRKDDTLITDHSF